jgi:signal transduction histidine kinase
MVPGARLRTVLRDLTHDEMADRLLIRREVATFPGKPDGPRYHWMIWGDRNSRGEIVMTFWETDWNDVLNERRAAFTMAASHEMRDPLTTLRGFSEILNMDTSNLTPEQAEAAAIIEATARHLTVLVDDVFDLSHNSFGELRLNLGETDLAPIVEAVVSTLRTRTEDSRQTLLCEIEAGLPKILADQARTTQMVSNLISNASIHNPEGTTIEVSVSSVDDRIAVAVADDGDGLPFEQPEDALQSFRRGSTATAGDRTGSGIGLALTKCLIELHRGEVKVRSTRGVGSCFTLLFPIDRETAPGRDQPGPA